MMRNKPCEQVLLDEGTWLGQVRITKSHRRRIRLRQRRVPSTRLDASDRVGTVATENRRLIFGHLCCDAPC
jgi:hypothetical protein